MVRLARAEVLDPGEVAIAHVFNRTVRRCFLMGNDPLSGKNFDHRKVWIENYLQQFAASFGIDLLGFAILSNHFHLILRSRPDVVATWDDTEVARRWLMLCPHRRADDGSPLEPSEPELNSIRGCAVRLAEIRSRLSNISWWMRLLSQRVAMRANQEDQETGRFFQDRYKAVRLLDEASLLACAAYVDLNPIRAALAEMSLSDYLQLLDWTARSVAAGRRGFTAGGVPSVVTRLGLTPTAWTELVSDFGRLFQNVAGRPECVDGARSRQTGRRYHVRPRVRQLMSSN